MLQGWRWRLEQAGRCRVRADGNLDRAARRKPRSTIKIIVGSGKVQYVQRTRQDETSR